MGKLIPFLFFSLIFALTPLERDEIILEGKGEIKDGRAVIAFSLPQVRNGLYLNLTGLAQYQVFLNGFLVAEVNKEKKTIDLSEKRDLLKESNYLEIFSLAEGRKLSYLLWQSSFRWYYGTFHAHTTYSDGRYSVSQLLNMVNTGGGNFCAITDHDTLGQCYDTAFHRTGNCVPIRGTEWTTDSGHANILGMEGRNSFPHRSVREMIDEGTYRGGLVQVNHPCDDELGMGWDHYPYLDPGIDAIEVFNSQTWFPEKEPDRDAEAVAWWHQLLTQGNRIAAAGNSDYHGTMPGEDPLEAHSAVYATSDHPDTLLKALKLGRVMVCDGMDDSRLYLYADTNDNGIMDLVMGENILIPSGSKRIKFRLEVEDADILDVVVVYSREGEIYRQTLETGGDFQYEWERTFTSSDTNFIRVELLALDGDYEYCTNPIYVNYPEYEFGPCEFLTQPIALPETLSVGSDETLSFSLTNNGLVSPHRFGILVAVETTGFDITDWQREGEGIGEVRNIPNLSGYELVEWRGGYSDSVRLSPNRSFNYWLSLNPRRAGFQRVFWRSWADDRLFVIENDPKDGFLGPDNEFWRVDSIFISSPTPLFKERDLTKFSLSTQPNPARERLAISLFGEGSPFSLRVYDGRGNLVKRFSSRSDLILWDLKGVKSGVYFLVFETESERIVKKVVVGK